MAIKIESAVAAVSGPESASGTTLRRMRLSVEEMPAEDQAQSGGGCDCDFCTLNCVG